MDGFILSAEIAAGLIVFIALLLGALLARRVWLGRHPGVFELSLRTPPGNWSIGLARYRSDAIEWYRVFSFSMAPARVLERSRLHIVGRRDLDDRGLGAGVIGGTIVRCRYDGVDLDFAMLESSYYGLSSWTEAAPPGQRHHL